MVSMVKVKSVLSVALLGLLWGMPLNGFCEDGSESSVGNSKRKTFSLGNVTVTVDIGKQKAIENPSGSAIYRLSRVGGTLSKLTATVSSIGGSPDLSRDGKAVAYDGWNAGQGCSDSHIFVYELATPLQVDDLGHGAMPSWSPDGKKLAFTQYSPGSGVGIMNADGTDRKIIDTAGWSAEWSPCEQKIAYTIRSHRGANIAVYDLKTEEKTLLFENSNLSFISWGISWSPDGKRLCCYARDRDGTKKIVVVHVEGEEREHRVISNPLCNELRASFGQPIAWGGDGDHVIFGAKGPGDKCRRLYRLHICGDSPPVEVGGVPEDMVCGDSYWHADGTILFMNQSEQ